MYPQRSTLLELYLNLQNDERPVEEKEMQKCCSSSVWILDAVSGYSPRTKLSFPVPQLLIWKTRWETNELEMRSCLSFFLAFLSCVSN